MYDVTIGLRKIGYREFARREGHSSSKAAVARNDVDLRVYRRVYTGAFTRGCARTA